MSIETKNNSNELSNPQRGAIVAAAALSLSGFLSAPGHDVYEPLSHRNSQNPSLKAEDSTHIAVPAVKKVITAEHPISRQAESQIIQTSAPRVHQSYRFSHTELHTQPKRKGLTSSEKVTKLPSLVLPTKLSPLPKQVSDTPTVTIMPELANLHPEKLSVPSDIESVMMRDTVYMPAAGCSGFLVRHNDTPIGVITAEHCSLRGNGPAPYFRQRYHGSDDRNYVIFPENADVMIGESMKTLEVVGQIHEFIVPNKTDSHLDLALGAFTGHTAREVLDTYNAMKLSTAEAQSITKNDTVFLSGWPDAQLNRNGANMRQSFAGRYVGDFNTTTTLGEQLKIHLVGVPVDKEGAVCSFGASGSQGFVKQDNQIRPIGTLASFVDLTGRYYGSTSADLQAKAYYERTLGVNLDGFGALCGFAYETPDSAEMPDVIQVVESLSDIPGQSIEDRKNKAYKEFFNPDIKKVIIDGDYGFNSGPDKGSAFEWVNRPALLYNSDDNSAILAWYDPTSVNNLHLDYIDNIEYLTFYKHLVTDPDIKMISSEGAMQPISLVNSADNAAFVDATGKRIGQVLSSDFQPANDSYFLQRSENMSADGLTLYKRTDLTLGGK